MTLLAYRESLGWSRAELAREAKLDYQTVTKAENGERITGRSARAIASALSTALGRTISIQEISGLNVGS
jgi:transcriptional regulator with XRE-family HTH domain